MNLIKTMKKLLYTLGFIFLIGQLVIAQPVTPPLEFTQGDGSSPTYPSTVKVDHTDNNDGTITISAGGTGDAVQVAGSAVDTTANFTNDGNIDFTLVDGGAGGPDAIKADYTETDPVYSAWDKSTGISITESQISDLQSYLTAEVDGSTTNEINTITLPDANVTAGLGITFAQSGPIAITESTPDTVTFTVTEVDPIVKALTGIIISNGSVISAITDSHTNWDTAYNHSQDNTQAHTDYLLNSGSDTMSGTLTADGLTIGNDELITFGTETFAFVTAGSVNDFDLSDDLNINDTDPHIRLVDTTASEDDFEIYADGNQFYLTNVTDSKEYFRINASNLIQFYDQTGFVFPDGAPADNQILKYDTALGRMAWEADAGGTEVNNLETVCTGIATTEIPIGTDADTVVYAALSGEATMANNGAVTLADSVAVTSWNLTTPTITTSLTTSTPTTLSAAELDRLDGLTSAIIENDAMDASLELLAIMDDETGTGTLVFNNSPTFADDIQLGLEGADGILKIYSEQGGTDYIASLYANIAMTSAASFYLPVDEPAATSFINMTTGGVMGFIAPNAGTDITADLEEEVTAGRSLTKTDQDIAADEETYFYTWRYGSFDPVATDDILQVDYYKKAVTLTEFRCYSDQTTVVQLQRNDGTPANIFTADVTCDSDGGSACASGCDTTLVDAEDNCAATDKLDLVTVSVSGTPTKVTLQLFGLYDD